jgi:predicted small metal-binding protein
MLARSLFPNLYLGAVIECPAAIILEGVAMAKVLRCRNLGLDCPKEVRAETEEELMKLAAEHAEKDHGFPAAMIPPSILAMVKAAIKDEWHIAGTGDTYIVFMYAPHEHAQILCRPVLSVACPGFSTVADIKCDVGATRGRFQV